MAPNPVSPAAPNLAKLPATPFQLSSGRRPQPSFSPPATLRRPRTSLARPRFALLDEQQQRQQALVSFTDEENSLIEALLGIQGRGRSASPQQLTVIPMLHCYCQYQFYVPFFLLNFKENVAIAGCGACSEGS